MKIYMGIDLGSVGTKIVLLDEERKICEKKYLRTRAEPINRLCDGLGDIFTSAVAVEQIAGVGVTGSGKELAALVLNADVTKNEISAHGAATSFYHPEVRTVFEIGGQDSKIITFRDGIINDFAMNSVCAAGTGSFLDQQATRLGISVEELGELALESDQEVSIAARCTVFAESDMIYKQQAGYAREDILYGLCTALVRNYMNTLARGKRIRSPICFQGGVAANAGMQRAFRDVLEEEIIVPEHYFYMGAIGAGFYAIEEKENYGDTGFSQQALGTPLESTPFVCNDCENRCSVLEYELGGKVIGYRGDVCGKYNETISENGTE